MKTPKKTDTKKGATKSKATNSKKLAVKPDEPKAGAVFTVDEDGFDEVPLDELDGFSTFSEFDDEDDY